LLAHEANLLEVIGEPIVKESGRNITDASEDAIQASEVKQALSRKAVRGGLFVCALKSEIKRVRRLHQTLGSAGAEGSVEVVGCGHFLDNFLVGLFFV
jgi:hypothetical protein